MEIVYNKRCPLCGCEKMIKRETPRIQINNGQCESDAINLGKFSGAFTTRYICYDCGYLLRFYEGEELEKVKKAANKK